jgi:DNA-binding SARP family transcriptional activator
MWLGLFDGFVLREGDCNVALPLQVQRLIALVALRTTLRREEASGTLWPEIPDLRAGARLRTTLWRLHRSGRDVLDTANGQLFLAESVDVDLKNWMVLALRVIDAPNSVAAHDLGSLRLCGELLPGWYDDWVLLERERVRQLQLHVLEAAADQLLRLSRHAAALEFALRALQMEQTRESAHRLVIRVHLAEGNTGEAWRQFEHCRDLLGRELGVDPSDELCALMIGRARDHTTGQRFAGQWHDGRSP